MLTFKDTNMYIEENENGLMTYEGTDHVLVYSSDKKIVLFKQLENKLYSTSPNKVFVGTEAECKQEIETLGLISQVVEE